MKIISSHSHTTTLLYLPKCIYSSPRCTKLMVGESSKRSHEMAFASKKKRPKRAGKTESVPAGDREHPTGRGQPGTSPVAAPASARRLDRPVVVPTASSFSPFPSSSGFDQPCSVPLSLHKSTRLGNDKLLLATGVRPELTSAIAFEKVTVFFFDKKK